MKNTSIEWADHTFNPWIGCTKVSPACDHCYAEKSMPATFQGITWGAGQPRKRTSAANWNQPLRWNAEAGRIGVRSKVFCASLADVFDNEVPKEWRTDLFALIEQTPNLDWLLLTKRIGNAARMIEESAVCVNSMLDANDQYKPLANVWLGATICNQEEADRDIPKLLQIPAAKRFLSIEPLLGQVAIWPYIKPHCERHRGPLDADGKCVACESRGIWGIGDKLEESEKAPIRLGVDWVIVGGESGSNARPMHPDWARSLRDQCNSAGVPFFFKQWGEWMPPESDNASYPAKDWRDVLDADGSTRRMAFSGARVLESSYQVVRVGKKAAGRLLDGRQWDEVPHAI